MRVLFVVFCVFLQFQSFSTQETTSETPSTETISISTEPVSFSTETSNPTTPEQISTSSKICTNLDSPQVKNIKPGKTTATLIWDTRQSNDNCIPSTLTVNCVARREKNVEGSKNSTRRRDVDSRNNLTNIDIDGLSENTNYTCNAILSGKQGDVSPSQEIAFQTLEEVPDAPLNLVVVETGSDNFTVQWDKPVKNPGDFIKYIIHIKSYGPNHFLPSYCSPNLDEHWNETTIEEYVFTGALPHYNYQFIVLLQNSAGNGSEASINTTTLTAASERPQEFNLGNSTIDNEENKISLNVTWEMPCETNGPIDNFNIEMDGFYTLDSDFSDFKNYTVKATTIEYYSERIEGLMPASNYSLLIRANGIEEEGYAFRTSFTTEDNLPGTPILRNLTNVGSSYFNISWEEPERRAGLIQTYNLWVISLGPIYEIDEGRCPPNNSVHNFNVPTEMNYNFDTGLPYYRYNITLAAVTSKGTGNPSIMVGETESATPEKPEDLQFELLDENVNVSWKTPCFSNGPISNFSITIRANYSEDDTYMPIQDDTRVIYQTGRHAYDHTIDLLESYHYNITVGVILENGIGGETDSINLTTPDGYPGPPIIIDVQNITENFFTILWERPTLRNGRILSYNISVTNKGPSYDTHCSSNYTNNYNYSKNGNITVLDFSEGEPFYNYEIFVLAETTKGQGNASTIYAVTTEQSVPENVRNIIHEVSLPTQEDYNGFARISFEPPCRMNGPLAQYNLTLSGTRNTFPPTELTIVNQSSVFYVPLKPEYSYEFNITTENGKFSNTTFGSNFLARSGVPQFTSSIEKFKVDAEVYTATVVLKNTDFDNTNGDIKYVAIILSEKNYLGDQYDKWDGKWPVIQSDDYYQVTEDNWNPFTDTDSVTFTIGDGPNCREDATYCNKPLESDRDYYLIVRIFTKAFYKNSHAIPFKTDVTSKLGIILGTIFGLLTVALFGIAGFLFWRNNNMKLPPLLYVTRKSSANKIPPDGLTSLPINKYSQYFKNLENNPEKFTEQYMSLTEKSKELAAAHTTSFAELTENRRKNRYTNILPFDATRVKLLIDEDDEIGSDYINASYIKGYTGKVEYIATQGPLPSTCRDFWKMVIQENVSIIVMVTQFVEDSKEKCYKYFPNNHESMTVGDDMVVRCTMELHFGTYCVRTIQVEKDTTQVTVTHMQYLDWPDFNVPKGTDTMLQFCHQLRERLKIEGGYVIVHCSAGVGRTGTLIATDILIQNINAGRNIDIFSTVLELRKQRMLMVQAQKQYVYIHSLIRDTLDQSRSIGLNDNLEPLHENQSAIQLKTDDDSLINKENEKESQF